MTSVSSAEIGGRRFATTHWSLVIAASQRRTPESERALSSLCQAYWYPLYAFVRRQGYSLNEAQDLTQEFFARLLEKEFLQTADRDRGRFRTFLLTVLKRFLANERKHAAALKRGGGKLLLSLDFTRGEEQLLLEPADDWTPERIYERQWALTLLSHVLDRVEEEYVGKGKGRLFEHLKVFLTSDSNAPSHAELAGLLAMTEGSIKVAIHRLRARYREALRAEIAQTVSGEQEVDDELHCLLAALRGG